MNSKRFTFGKHKGEEVSQVAEEDPSYVVWVKNNVEWFEIDDDILSIAEAEEQKRKQEKFNEYRKDKIAEICGFFNPKPRRWEDQCVIEDEFGSCTNEFW